MVNNILCLPCTLWPHGFLPTLQPKDPLRTANRLCDNKCWVESAWLPWWLMFPHDLKRGPAFNLRPFSPIQRRGGRKHH